MNGFMLLPFTFAKIFRGGSFMGKRNVAAALIAVMLMLLCACGKGTMYIQGTGAKNWAIKRLGRKALEKVVNNTATKFQQTTAWMIWCFASMHFRTDNGTSGPSWAGWRI